MKPKFDGYAAQYDAWFMENENLFQSELRLFQKVLGDIQANVCFPLAAEGAKVYVCGARPTSAQPVVDEIMLQVRMLLLFS